MRLTLKSHSVIGRYDRVRGLLAKAKNLGGSVMTLNVFDCMCRQSQIKENNNFIDFKDRVDRNY